MSNKKHAKAHHGRENKKEQFSKPARRNSNFLLWLVIVGLLGIVGYLVVSRLRSDPTTATASAKTIQLS